MKFYLDHLKDLGGNHAAELYYEYLVQMDKMMAKDRYGYFSLTVTRVEEVLGLKRYAQDKARKLLIEKGWLRCRQGGGKSPAIKFKILEQI